MKITRILLFFISIYCVSFSLWAQETNEESMDTIVTANRKYGIRLGVDMLKLVRTAIESGYSGFEIIGDVRFSKRFYAAAELGFEDRKWDKDNLVSMTNGSYIKVGADFNAYRNWLGMNNAISAGLRYGLSSFSQELISYPIYTTDTTFPTVIRDESRKYSGLNASWVEFIFGVKTEVFNNLYLSINVQLKRLLNEKKPDNFDNLIIPGFNRTNDYSEFGVGYGYSISYLIPIFRK
jgi:Domain of unknown function (DUF6048)